MNAPRVQQGRLRARLAVCTCVLACAAVALTGVVRTHLSFGPGVEAHAGLATGTDRDEYELKAAILFNFVRYTKWPKDAFRNTKSPLIVAVVGKDPFGNRLSMAFKGKKIGGRSVLIRHYPSAKDIGPVHVLILGDLDKKERKRCIEKIKRKPVLTIADTGGAEAMGTIIGFYREGKRIKFEIAPSRVKDARLKMRSQVFNSARIVRLKK